MPEISSETEAAQRAELIAMWKVIKLDVLPTFPYANVFYKAKYNIPQDLLQCFAAFAGSTAIMVKEHVEFHDATIMTAKMMAAMALSKIAYNLSVRSYTIIYYEFYNIQQNITSEDIIKHDVLSATPIFSTFFKANFGKDHELMQCTAAIVGSVGVMTVNNGNFQDSVDMTVNMLGIMAVSRSVLNLSCRGLAAGGNMLYSYMQRCRSRTLIEQATEVEMQRLNSDSVPELSSATEDLDSRNTRNTITPFRS